MILKKLIWKLKYGFNFPSYAFKLDTKIGEEISITSCGFEPNKKLF